jgi:lactate dehydrogenase-like 2-hydroxyacid dehydrogenase
LNTSRRISESIIAAKVGLWSDWKIKWMCGQGLSGSTVGIFGLGRIGLAVGNLSLINNFLNLILIFFFLL